MTREDFVPIPRYDMKTLTTPMESLTNPLRDENIPAITAKLFYSTRYLGKYDLDAGEWTGEHAGVDLKLARGTGVGAVGGGRVLSVATSKNLGLHVVIEHRMKNGETYYSTYGHFDSATVSAGQDVEPGQTIGFVGMTGNTSAPHLHLQIGKGKPGGHTPWQPGDGNPDASMVNPVTFLGTWRNGE
jgi:murein DD-endopeptidase MepM/ murein hydrolase activator NlpD